MEYVFVPGRHVLSRPDKNDRLIRSWLSRQRLRMPTHVKNGTVWVGDYARANYLTALMARRWDEVFPQPTVGIWKGVPLVDESYNGWNNYETWVVFLWIDKEQRKTALPMLRGGSQP